MNTSPSPTAIAWAAELIAWSPDAAQPVDGQPADLDREVGEQQGHPGDVAVVLAGLVGAAEDDVLDRAPGRCRRGRRRARRTVAARSSGRTRRQGAAVAADRGADGLDDPGIAERRGGSLGSWPDGSGYGRTAQPAKVDRPLAFSRWTEAPVDVSTRIRPAVPELGSPVARMTAESSGATPAIVSADRRRERAVVLGVSPPSSPPACRRARGGSSPASPSATHWPSPAASQVWSRMVGSRARLVDSSSQVIGWAWPVRLFARSTGPTPVGAVRQRIADERPVGAERDDPDRSPPTVVGHLRRTGRRGPSDARRR